MSAPATAIPGQPRPSGGSGPRPGGGSGTGPKRDRAVRDVLLFGFAQTAILTGLIAVAAGVPQW